MSDTTTIETAPTRRPRSERSQTPREEDPPEPQVIIEPPGSETSAAPVSEADNALADTRRLLKQAEDDRNAATVRARAADAARIAAERSANSSQLNNRADLVHANLEAGKSEASAAKVAYQAAREAGDVAGEIAAQQLLAEATYKVRESSRELEWLQAQAEQAKTAPAQTETQGYKPSAAAQKWIDEHPLYSEPNSVTGARAYRALARELHNEAMQAGHRDGSEEYIQYIERGLTDELGEGHGQVGGRSKSVAENERPMRGGEAMRPSGGASNDGGGWQTARIPLGHNGTVALVKYRGPPENRRIQFARPEDMDNFNEGAAVSYRALYEKDPNRALARYVNDHIQNSIDGYPDLKTGDGQGYR